MGNTVDDLEAQCLIQKSNRICIVFQILLVVIWTDKYNYVINGFEVICGLSKQKKHQSCSILICSLLLIITFIVNNKQKFDLKQLFD